MSFMTFLNQTCTITRPNKTGVDRYNANAYSDSTVASDVPCRLVEKSVKLIDTKSSEYTWVKAKMLLMPVSVTVKRFDEATVGSTVYRIVEVLMRQRGNTQHHQSCVVEVVNG